MPNEENRASQFHSFDALKGFQEVLREVERMVEAKKQFSPESFQKLDDRLTKLQKNDFVVIEHYYHFSYLETAGKIQKIDFFNRFLFLSHTKIFFDDIIGIEVKENRI